MALKQDIVYQRGRSKSVEISHRLIVQSDDDGNPEYVPPGSLTPALAFRATRCTPKKVVHVKSCLSVCVSRNISLSFTCLFWMKFM